MAKKRGRRIFRRKGAPERAAAAVAWVVTRANESAGAYGGARRHDIMESRDRHLADD